MSHNQFLSHNSRDTYSAALLPVVLTRCSQLAAQQYRPPGLRLAYRARRIVLLPAAAMTSAMPYFRESLVPGDRVGTFWAHRCPPC